MTAWLPPRLTPLDHNGPTNVPHDPLPPDWILRPVVDIFEGNAFAQPHADAVIDPATTLTYEEVFAAVCSLARRIDAGTSPDGVIAILLPNCAWYPVAVLACQAAHRTCVLLDSNYPAERNAGIMRAARLSGVITEGDHQREDGVPEDVTRIPVTIAADSWPTASHRLHRHDPDRPAFIIYTSGSTGQPKGLVQSSRTILRRVGQLIDSKHLNPGDRFLSLASPCTIDGLFDSLAALLSGAALLKIDIRRNGLREVLHFARNRRPTILLALPTILRALAELPDAAEALSTLRVVRTSGDALLRADFELIRSRLPFGCHFLTVFGATEAGAILQWFITPDVMPAGLRMPAGYPLPGYRLAIIDDDGEPVPPGTVGELIVSSSFTALGEWQHGRCIPGRLQPDPEDPSCRILHTGDLARLRSDGLFVLVGRRDRQIKIGGRRVEPAEIENTLRRSPHVSEAVVLAQREGADIRLIAFVVPARGSNARLADDLREMLRSTIPAHMQPANIVLVDTIPLLPGGKVDGQAMLAGAAAAATRATAAAGCFAETHASGRSRAIVARAWHHVLNRTSYDQDLRFDEADGDSLRLLQLVFRLEQLCGTALPLDAFQGDLRPSGFARSLDRILSGEPAASSRLRAVVLLPGMGNDEPRLARFRAACAHELTIVPIDYGDWSEWVAPGSDFSTLAASVVARIQTNIPSGPVTLAGYSMGGRVAYNAAQMLISAGRSIGLVAILDADALPLDESQEAHVPMSRPQELREFVTSWKTGQAADAAARIIVRRLSSPRWASILRLAAGLRKARWLGDLGFFLNWRINMAVLSKLEEDWRQAAERQPPLDVPVVLFRSQAHGPDTPADLGWGAFCRNLTVCEVGGDHRSMIDDPNLGPLCARFTASIVATRAQGCPPHLSVQGADRA